MIFVTLDVLIEDIDGICRLAKSSDEDVILWLGSDYEEESTDEQNNMIIEQISAKAGDENADMPTFTGQKGFMMIELIIAVTLISIVFIAVGALTSLSTNGIALVQRKRAAENYAVELSSKLKADQKIMLPEGGAFRIDAATGEPIRRTDATVKLNCSEMYCDRIVSVPSEIEGTSADELVYTWDASLPEGASVKFVRAWALSDEDAERNWRRITIAVFPPDSELPVTYSVTGGVIK